MIQSFGEQVPRVGLVLIGLVFLAACGNGSGSDAGMGATESVPTATSSEAVQSTPVGDAGSGAVITPDASGRCVAFSIDEAQAASAFPLVLPDEVPESFALEVLLLQEMAAGPLDGEDCGGADYVEARYTVIANGERQPPIKFIQTTFEPSFDGQDAEDVDIKRKDVTRYSNSASDTDTTVFYVWQAGDVSYVLDVPGDSLVEEDELMLLIASVP